MEIKTVTNYQNDQNCYIVYEKDTAVAIDPGSAADKIMKCADEQGVKITDIIITHCHYDHIEGLEELREKCGAKLWATDEASENIQNDMINLSRICCEKSIIAKPAEHTVGDGEKFELCGLEFKCIKTPGHTSCSSCFLCGENLFCGDTLFLRAVGRSDLPTGDGEILERSIKEKLYVLDDDICVYSGHGKATSIGYEKKFNFYVKG